MVQDAIRPSEYAILLRFSVSGSGKLIQLGRWSKWSKSTDNDPAGTKRCPIFFVHSGANTLRDTPGSR